MRIQPPLAAAEASVLSRRENEGFTAGHTKEKGECTGGVLEFENCKNITIEKIRYKFKRTPKAQSFEGSFYEQKQL